MLGAAYHLGAGVPRDPVVALSWLLRGREGGSELAVPFLDAVRASLTPVELARARELAEKPLPEPVA